MTFSYRFLGLTLVSDVCLPGVFPDDQGSVDLRLVRTEPDFDKGGFQVVHEWRDTESEGAPVVLTCARNEKTYRLSFPNGPDIWLSRERATVWYSPDTSVSDLSHRLSAQVLPRLVAGRGELVLHAAGVVTPGGAVGLVGASGSGKSTLAASCQADGLNVLSDDCLGIRCDGTLVEAVGSHPGIRVYPESVLSLSLEPPTHPSPDDMGKVRLASRPPPGAVADLRSLIVLKPSEDLALQEMTGAEASMRLMSEAYSLDPSDRVEARSRLSAISKLLGSGIRVYKLSYPGTPECLPEVRGLIRAAGSHAR